MWRATLWLAWPSGGSGGWCRSSAVVTLRMAKEAVEGLSAHLRMDWPSVGQDVSAMMETLSAMRKELDVVRQQTVSR